MGSATIKDIALALGVSPSTVSRGLNDRPGLSKEVRNQVRDVAARVGYRPSGVARALRSNATRTLGLIVPSILNPFFTDLAHAAEVAARARGFSVVIGNSDEDPRYESEYLKLMMERRVDGLLIAPSRDHNRMIEEFLSTGAPVIFLDRSPPGLDVPTVDVDPAEALAALARHFAELGHRRVGILLGPEDVAVSRERAESFAAAGQRFGLTFEPRHQARGDFSVEGGAAAFSVLMKEPPDAIFITNNRMTEGFLLAAAKAGVRIGQDIAIASFDDVPLFQLYHPPITAIQQPTRAMGEIAVDLLLRRIAGEEVASVRLAAKVAFRASCGEDRR
jgi:LacI family transcriptional regulator